MNRTTARVARSLHHHKNGALQAKTQRHGSFLSSDKVEYRARSNYTSERERAKTVSAYYNQPAIEAAAKKASVRLTPFTILYSGSTTHQNVMRSAMYLQKELPIRLAKRVMEFRALPFIVGCNPTILGVHELYIRAFNILHKHDRITNDDDELAYSKILRQLLDDHKDVVTQLAAGFRECRRHVSEERTVVAFLDRTLTSRLAIRMLAQHHLWLRDTKPNYVGIINKHMKLKEVVERNCQFVARIAQHKYGKVPEMKLSGHVNATFPYIEMPLDYILPELLKNAARATVETHSEYDAHHLPPINITIASNEVDFIIRVSDRGGGIPHHLMDKVLNYNFTTADKEDKAEPDLNGGGSGGTHSGSSGIFANFMEVINPNPAGGPMHGFGFGLPTSRAYAQYLGGSLTIQTMQGIGTDVYLRLKHINSKADSFRI
ncbi:branched-chain alpha-ketoacid dehydrogenase kinase-like [Oratosquilla oratoria]|uniref:branched-chain alpha-ketoacid dehydrogenase kinase-like n=1 Tax=Oratosquilla oratoria TaxID=337810 RepID=UPI003F75D2D1